MRNFKILLFVCPFFSFKTSKWVFWERVVGGMWYGSRGRKSSNVKTHRLGLTWTGTFTTTLSIPVSLYSHSVIESLDRWSNEWRQSIKINLDSKCWNICSILLEKKGKLNRLTDHVIMFIFCFSISSNLVKTRNKAFKINILMPNSTFCIGPSMTMSSHKIWVQFKIILNNS